MKEGKQHHWETLSQEDLLKVSLSDLRVRYTDSPLLRKCTQRLLREIQQKGIHFRPHFWLSDEWFTPDGVGGIAIPFYLSHPRLSSLERQQMFEVEGGMEATCMKILRHEAGHALENAFELRRRRVVRETFGSSKVSYPKTYSPRPYSKKYVLHLDSWYAQSHPDEDFAETFAVWLTPESDWKSRYEGWPALRKLEVMDELMRSIQGKAPRRKKRTRVDPLSTLHYSLAHHYESRRKHFGLSHPDFYDRDLRKVFTLPHADAKNMTAAAFLRKIRRRVRRKVSSWTGTYQYTIDRVIEDMIHRSAELGLRLKDSEEETLSEFTVLLSVQTMNYLHSGRHRVAL